MTSNKNEWSFNRIARLADLSDLAEPLFPGNRSQQHAFLAVWLSLKWAITAWCLTWAMLPGSTVSQGEPWSVSGFE